MNEENKFHPSTSSHGNVNGEIARVRNIFLSAEFDYFKELLLNEKNVKVLLGLLDMPPDVLFSEAQKRIDMIENGMVEEDNLEIVEAEITFLLSAIQDKVRILELVKTMHLDDSNGLRR